MTKTIGRRFMQRKTGLTEVTVPSEWRSAKVTAEASSCSFIIVPFLFSVPVPVPVSVSVLVRLSFSVPFPRTFSKLPVSVRDTSQTLRRRQG